jgi:hypothetical protein
MKAIVVTDPAAGTKCVRSSASTAFFVCRHGSTVASRVRRCSVACE